MGVYLGSDAVDMHGGFVTGGASGVKLQSKTVTPSENTQTVNPDSSYDALSSVTVEAISNTYIGSSVTKKSAATYTPGTSDQNIASGQYLNGTQTIKGDSNLTAANIKSGVKIFNVTGSYAGSSSGGNTPNLQTKTVTPSESTQTVSPDSGYDGLSKVTVNAISSTYIGSDVTKKKRSNLHPEDNQPEHCIWAIPERDTNNQGRCKPGGRKHQKRCEHFWRDRNLCRRREFRRQWQ